MKSIITICLIMIGLSSWAQLDLSVQITDPLEGVELEAGADVTVDLELTNLGDLLTGELAEEVDTLYLGFVLNEVFYGPFVGTLGGVGGVAGGGVSFPVEDVITFNDLDDGIYNLCAWIIGVGNVGGQNFDLNGLSNLDEIGDITILDVAMDPTPENNEHCVEFYVGDTSIVIDDVSVGENEADKYNFYPNPAADNLTVEAPVEGGQVVLSALNGDAVLTELVSGKAVLDVTGIAPGMYVLSLRGMDGVVIKNEKVVIRR